jgi:AhpD family alkylhydroperoxidase
LTRIDAPARPGALTRLLLRSARRKTAQLAGRETPRMLEPLEAYAHAPGLLLGYGTFELASSRQGRVPHRLTELASLKAATVANCEYCIDIGSAIARRTGLSDEQLLALPRHRDSGLFDERELLVLDYAAAMTRTPVAVSDELFAQLCAHFDEAQIVELTSAIALENLRARFNAALEIGAAGFSEGMVCALPEAPASAEGAPGAPFAEPESR